MSRSVVVIRCFSSEGRRCVYDLVGKSGRVWRRSVMSGGHRLAAEVGNAALVVVDFGSTTTTTLLGIEAMESYKGHEIRFTIMNSHT